MMVDVDSTNSVADGDYYYAHDHLHSATALMDSAGDVVERYEYDAYGNTHFLSSAFSVLSSSQYANPYTFTGRRLDTLDSDNFELMYYRHRYYSPQIGRFLTQDPLGVNPAGGVDNRFRALRQYRDGVNLYQYVRSNPTLFLDHFGLKSLPSPTGVGIGMPITDEGCAQTIAKVYTLFFLTFWGLPGAVGNDKYAHCYVSCRLAQNCGGIASYWGGWIRDGWKHDDDDATADMGTNSAGIACGTESKEVCGSSIKNSKQCEDCCGSYGDSNGMWKF